MSTDKRAIADQVLTFYPLSPSDKAFMSCGAVILCCIALWGWATYGFESRGRHFKELSCGKVVQKAKDDLRE
ncbi:Protein of unknown function [Pyronema omphalodes CBS 100304]|uniref:Uncharacterized protein n=1 Tax=Pyronema omphalodes (strain CBS 100304) TaxID=1076935 RepID=U4KZ74_PYROM|nr:Protein of unknown function [Pyronema omphalodes CBS 100304]